MDVHDFPEKSQVKPERISKEKSQNVAEELARAPAGEGLGAKGVPRRCQGGAKASTKKGNDDESDPHIIIYIYTDTYPEADTVDIYIYMYHVIPVAVYLR